MTDLLLLIGREIGARSDSANHKPCETKQSQNDFDIGISPKEAHGNSWLPVVSIEVNTAEL